MVGRVRADRLKVGFCLPTSASDAAPRRRPEIAEMAGEAVAAGQ